jgi:hypothetical protein
MRPSNQIVGVVATILTGLASLNLRHLIHYCPQRGSLLFAHSL